MFACGGRAGPIENLSKKGATRGHGNSTSKVWKEILAMQENERLEKSNVNTLVGATLVIAVVLLVLNLLVLVS